MKDRVGIFEDKMSGLFEVCHNGTTVAEFQYCTNEEEQDYMTRNAAKKLALKIARYLISRGTFPTTKG